MQLDVSIMKSFIKRLLCPLLIGGTILAIGYGFASLLRGDYHFSTWPLSLQSVVVIFALFAALISGLIIFGGRNDR